MQDAIIRCGDCGVNFAWTVAEQTGQPQPDRCPMCRRLAPAPGCQRGVVKWFSRSKGYGFIIPMEGPELFLHKSGLAPERPPPRAGQLVEFRVSHSDRGAQAEDVVILEPEVVKQEG